MNIFTTLKKIYTLPFGDAGTTISSHDDIFSIAESVFKKRSVKLALKRLPFV